MRIITKPLVTGDFVHTFDRLRRLDAADEIESDGMVTGRDRDRSLAVALSSHLHDNRSGRRSELTLHVCRPECSLHVLPVALLVSEVNRLLTQDESGVPVREQVGR
mgnify:CR=1 FL=1